MASGASGSCVGDPGSLVGLIVGVVLPCVYDATSATKFTGYFTVAYLLIASFTLFEWFEIGWMRIKNTDLG
jgi:hypothetical protein